MSKKLFSLILLLSLIFQSISRRNLLEETTEKENEKEKEKETQQQTEEEDSCEHGNGGRAMWGC